MASPPPYSECEFDIEVVEDFELGPWLSTTESNKKFELGIFWDIENCRVPSKRSAAELVEKIRHFLAVEHSECGYAYDFVCACDVLRLRSQGVVDQLNRVGVDVLHVNGMAKNAADEKLKECIEKFVDRHGPGSRLVLISGDANFVPAMRAARRKGVYTINFYPLNCTAQDLRFNCNETHPFELFLSDLPSATIPQSQPVNIKETCDSKIEESQEVSKNSMSTSFWAKLAEPGIADPTSMQTNFWQRVDTVD